ncbi:type II toxin-antitoxin system RelE/ParE family toxin [Dulcicalothrix desertica]|uniref:type II toxin-antitoxin system RelE/ParE family toxin n=1 Tax=Dulcicalothrix desertica TaxID=32056 RepID=UPI00119A6DB4|nr:type II toxin-antitoxin system RelE/ParE family toxin [Dulcicalothrix desertica]TWH43798.1 hypothetical protein CAL7102_07542 [Dulcicalothrix desertica PCC 7102]
MFPALRASDADAAFLTISQFTTAERAQVWYQGLIKAIASLKEMPRCCPIAREDTNFHAKKFANFFTGKGSKPTASFLQLLKTSPRTTVRILYIRHGAQKTVGEPEVEN